MSRPTAISPEEQEQIARQIGVLLLQAVPENWQQITVEYRATGEYHDLLGEITTQDGTTEPWEPPTELPGIFEHLREGMYRPDVGTWLSALYVVERPSSYRIDINFDSEPSWHQTLPRAAYADELRRYPRAEENIPEWMWQKLDGSDSATTAAEASEEAAETGAATNAPETPEEPSVPNLPPSPEPASDHRNAPDPVAVGTGASGTDGPGPDSAPGRPLSEPAASVGFDLDETADAPPETIPEAAGRVPEPDGVLPGQDQYGPGQALSDSKPLRVAEIFENVDDQGRPMLASRQPVPLEDVGPLRQYLETAPLVRRTPEQHDELDPQRPATVPGTWHSDGTWLWPGAVPYYLAQYGVPPQPELLTHIRERAFAVPEVDEDTVRAADAFLEADELGTPENAVAQVPIGAQSDESGGAALLGVSAPEPGIDPESPATGETPAAAGQRGLPHEESATSAGISGLPPIGGTNDSLRWQDVDDSGTEHADAAPDYDLSGTASARHEASPTVPPATSDPVEAALPEPTLPPEPAESSQWTESAAPADTLDDSVSPDPVGDAGVAAPEVGATPLDDEIPAVDSERVIAELHDRLSEYQVDSSEYRIGSRADGARCLVHDGTGWVVTETDAEVRFARVDHAAAYLLGSLLMQRNTTASPATQVDFDTPSGSDVPAATAMPEVPSPSTATAQAGGADNIAPAIPDTAALAEEDPGAAIPKHPGGGNPLFTANQPTDEPASEPAPEPAPDPAQLAAPAAAEAAQPSTPEESTPAHQPPPRPEPPMQPGSPQAQQPPQAPTPQPGQPTGPPMNNGAPGMPPPLPKRQPRPEGGAAPPPSRGPQPNPNTGGPADPRAGAPAMGGGPQQQQTPMPPRPQAPDANGRPPHPAGQPPAPGHGQPPANPPAGAQQGQPAMGGPAPSGGQQQIQPLSGEPPLTLYRDRRQIVLQPGTELDRFGEPGGNVTYAFRTPYSSRSLPPQWANRAYYAYRVQRPLQALRGSAVPWFEQSGGGTAYVLPVSVSELLADGALVEMPSNEAPRPPME